MQFATLFSLSLAAFSFAPTTLACHMDSSDKSKSQDCCWGGKTNSERTFGFAGCWNQHPNTNPCKKKTYQDDFCGNHDVTEKDC
ncbi:hypothetical protein EG328_011541 [Venturia inaequalis]|uniref:Uncharacterized protein n=1 Tax=Venturia inaequalis TaxID=5025 RepID=A0A8H3V214_VENIN|nr:hypothetical protein EG328_011541 [Venturia inaequalis]